MQLTFRIDKSRSGKTYTVTGNPIVIGRAPDANVVLADDCVSGQHAKVSATPQDCVLTDLSSTNGTYVNGTRVTRSKICPRDMIRFGTAGPAMRVIKVEVNGVTDSSAPQSTRALVVNLERSHRRSRHMLAAIFAVLSVVGACLFGGWRFMGRNKSDLVLVQHQASTTEANLADAEVTAAAVSKTVRNLERKASSFERGLGAARRDNQELAERIEEISEGTAAQILDDYSNSVFLVKVPGRSRQLPHGTAFAVNSSGLLATNAHVAGPVKKLLKLSASVFVVAQGGKRRYRVYEAGCHPGYDSSSMLGKLTDVGWLRVQLAGDRLKPVKLASSAEIYSLKPGLACCYMGFPVFIHVEGKNWEKSDYARPEHVVVRAYSGNIVRCLGANKKMAPPQKQHLIEHNMHSWGGASGSPVFSATGKVVALHFAADYANGVARSKWAVRVDRLIEALPEGWDRE